MTGTLAILAITASLLTGYWLYKTLGSSGANGAYDAVATVSSVFWIMAGIFAILGGFVWMGMFLIILFTFIGVTKGKATESRIRGRIAGSN